MKIFQRILHVPQMKKYLEVSHCVENLNQQYLGWLVINHLMELLIQPKLININTHIHSNEQSLLICVEKIFLIKPQDFIMFLVHLWFSWKTVSYNFIFTSSVLILPWYDFGIQLFHVLLHYSIFKIFCIVSIHNNFCLNYLKLLKVRCTNFCEDLFS